jgi:general secretion pathway protein C
MFDLPSLADSERLSRFAALAACALAGALGLWLLVRCVWLFVPQGGATAAAAPLVPVAAAQSPAASVAQWHLFGNAQSVDLAARAQNAPRTALKLSLRGTLALADPKQGIAIIANEGNLEHGFKVGDAVGSATLVDVYSDHVVLDHDGAAESLSLPRAELRATASAGANQPGAAPLPNAPASMPDNSTAPAARGGAMPTLAGLNARCNSNPCSKRARWPARACPAAAPRRH